MRKKSTRRVFAIGKCVLMAHIATTEFETTADLPARNVYRRVNERLVTHLPTWMPLVRECASMDMMRRVKDA